MLFNLKKVVSYFNVFLLLFLFTFLRNKKYQSKIALTYSEINYSGINITKYTIYFTFHSILQVHLKADFLFVFLYFAMFVYRYSSSTDTSY